MVCSMFVLISKICDLKHFCGRQYMTNLTLFKIFENLFQFSSKLYFRNGAASCHFNNSCPSSFWFHPIVLFVGTSFFHLKWRAQNSFQNQLTFIHKCPYQLANKWEIILLLLRNLAVVRLLTYRSRVRAPARANLLMSFDNELCKRTLWKRKFF